MREPVLVYNGESQNVYNEILESLKTCESFIFNVAFITYGGLQLLVDAIDKHNKVGKKGKFMTSTYLEFSDPKAIKKLLDFEHIETKVYTDNSSRGFHSKAYIFEYKDHYKILVGSSNVTVTAFKRNIEWNVKIISKKEDAFAISVISEFEKLWESTGELDNELISKYEEFYNVVRDLKRAEKKHFEIFDEEIKMNKMQVRAIKRLENLRNDGETKALIIAATATGKTYMSAFDVKMFKPRKFLFIVHREDILQKAEESFKVVLGKEINTGFFTGAIRNKSSQYIFATIQSLKNNFNDFRKDEFDYIAVDEAHHAASPSFVKVLEYFTPRFTLGMTATPERCDGNDIFELFDNNVAIEIRLQEAMEENLVVPFHYFGIKDVEGVNFEDINLSDVSKVAKLLEINTRVDYIIEKMNLYGYDGEKRKCIGFCVTVEHAKYMAKEFTDRGIPSICISGENSIDERTRAINDLENEKNPLQIIFTVDVFSEGVDIPSVNLVLMLRPTESPIVFIQQLGRGLRKYNEKEYLTVLDFIGNYSKSFLVAIALKGSRYYDKDSLMVAVQNNFRNIPGESFVQMDEVSKEQILKQLKQENFNSIKYLKEEYQSFKTVLSGKTPRFMMDYLSCDSAPDVMRFVKDSYSYQEFLSKVETDPIYELNAIEDKQFIKCSRTLSWELPLKRPHEFAILDLLLKKEKIKISELELALKKYCSHVRSETLTHALECLDHKYFDILNASKRMKLINWDGEIITKSDEFTSLLSHGKSEYLEDIIRYGLIRYQEEYGDEDYGIPFLKINQTYTMQDLAILSNYRKMISAFRGSGVLTNGNDYFLFVDLHKNEDIKESIKYKDKFISRSMFQWESPNNTGVDSERGKNLIDNKKRGINLHLFVRKSKEKKYVLPYFYLGKMNAIYHENEKPILIHGELENEVSVELYDELTTRIDID